MLVCRFRVWGVGGNPRIRYSLKLHAVNPDIQMAQGMVTLVYVLPFPELTRHPIIKNPFTVPLLYVRGMLTRREGGSRSCNLYRCNYDRYRAPAWAGGARSTRIGHGM